MDKMEGLLTSCGLQDHTNPEDHRANAEKAVKVKNLGSCVSSEHLEEAFSRFGEVERAVVNVDKHGKSMREGIIEFATEAGAQMALQQCTEGCFFLTESLRPVELEPFEQLDSIDDTAEKNLPKNDADLRKPLKVGPHFAAPGSVQYEYGMRWKKLQESYKEKQEALQLYRRKVRKTYCRKI